MRTKLSFLLLSFFLQFNFKCLNAQNHDFIWIFGGGSTFGMQPPPFSDSRLDFNFAPPLISIDPKHIILRENCIVTSDYYGNFQFYSNGKIISKANHQQMANGTGLNPGDHASGSGANYVSAPQGILTIPVPEDQ